MIPCLLLQLWKKEEEKCDSFKKAQLHVPQSFVAVAVVVERPIMILSSSGRFCIVTVDVKSHERVLRTIFERKPFEKRLCCEET
jgi:hypothetical protein